MSHQNPSSDLPASSSEPQPGRGVLQGRSWAPSLSAFSLFHIIMIVFFRSQTALRVSRLVSNIKFARRCSLALWVLPGSAEPGGLSDVTRAAGNTAAVLKVCPQVKHVAQSRFLPETISKVGFLISAADLKKKKKKKDHVQVLVRAFSSISSWSWLRYQFLTREGWVFSMRTLI